MIYPVIVLLVAGGRGRAADVLCPAYVRRASSTISRAEAALAAAAHAVLDGLQPLQSKCRLVGRPAGR